MAALPIERAVASMAKPRGYRKSARTWHKACPESVLVLNLQKSQWGEPQLYINLGVYLRDLGPEVTPPEHRCHIRARLERVCPPEYFARVRSASSVEEAVGAAAGGDRAVRAALARRGTSGSPRRDRRRGEAAPQW
jgi:hypothetical protein